MMDFALRVNSEDFKAEARANQKAHKASMAAAQAERDRLWAEYRAKQEELKREREEALRPLKEALRAAGIKLKLTSYEGVWGEYQIGNGPVVAIDDDYFDTFEED
jgi:hypothetical protein